MNKPSLTMLGDIGVMHCICGSELEVARSMTSIPLHDSRCRLSGIECSLDEVRMFMDNPGIVAIGVAMQEIMQPARTATRVQ